MIQKTIITLVFCGLLVTSFVTTTFAEAPVSKVGYKQSYTTDEVKQIATFYAKKYDVSSKTILAVVECESSFNTQAIGDHGKSFGLSQIHSPSHPSITREQAENPYFALDFMASNIADGKGSMWSCYRKIRGV